MSRTCPIITSSIKKLSELIRNEYPEQCNSNGFNDLMCAEWVGMYIDGNNKNNPDFIPSSKLLIDYIEKNRNREGKSFIYNNKISIEYTPKGKQTLTYTINGAHIFNKNGEEVFAENSIDRNKIFANLAVKQGRAVIVDYKDSQYVVNDEDKIISVTSGKLMQWEDNNGNRKAILKLALDKFKSSTAQLSDDNEKQSSVNVSSEFKAEIKKLRGYFEGSATINQEYPNLPDNLIDKLADYFLGDYKLTDSDYVELGKYIKFDGILLSKQNNSLNNTLNNKLIKYGKEFRGIQESIRGRSDEVRDFHSGKRVLQKDERERLSVLLQNEILSLGSNSGRSDGTLISAKGTKFNILKGVNGLIFHDVFEIVRNYLPNGELVDLHDNYDNCTCYLSSDGLSGFAIEDNGNLVSLFNLRPQTAFSSAIKDYVIKEGATHLDAYNSSKQPLETIYSKVFGAKTASTMDYNMEYDHDDIAKNHGNPKVVFMILGKDAEKNILNKSFDKDSYEPAQLNQLSYLSPLRAAELINKPNISEYERYSGAAKGSDTEWKEIGEKEFGLPKGTDYTVNTLDNPNLTKENKLEIDDAYKKAVKELKRVEMSANTYLGKLVRRDYLQAKAADSVFAIGRIINPGEIGNRGYKNNANHQIVDGGTGYAVLMAIDMNKPVHVYDLNKKQWFTYKNGSFEAEETPALTKKFAAIGTREITEDGKQAIRDVYNKTFNVNSVVENNQLNTDNEKNFVKTQNSDTDSNSDIRPISPSFESALKPLESNLIKLYNAFSPDLIVARGLMLAEEFSSQVDDIVTERQDYYQNIINSLDSTELEKQDASKWLSVYNNPVDGRQAAVIYKGNGNLNNGFNNIMNSIKDSIIEYSELATDDTVKQKYDNVIEYFDLLVNEASKQIELSEGININPEQEDEDDASMLDNELGSASNGNEGWGFKEKYNNPFTALSKQVKRVLNSISKNEKDDLGFNKYYTQAYVYSTLMSYLAKNLDGKNLLEVTSKENYSQLESPTDVDGIDIDENSYPNGYPTFPVLEEMKIKYPWVQQVINRLTKDYRSPEYNDDIRYPSTGGNITSLFYTNFKKAFIPYAKIMVGYDKDGNAYYGTIALNHDIEEKSQFEQLSTSYNNGITYSENSIYNNDKTLNIDNAKKLSDIISELNDVSKLEYLYTGIKEASDYDTKLDDEYQNQLNRIYDTIRAFGIDVSHDNVVALVMQEENGVVIQSMLLDLKAIADRVQDLKPESNYLIDVTYSKNNNNRLLPSFFENRGFVTEVSYMQSFWDSASKKTLYSYSADNYLQKTMRFLNDGNISFEKRKKYIDEHFGPYEWYRDLKAPLGKGWKLMWLEDAYNNEHPQNGLPYKNINNVTYKSVHPYSKWDNDDIMRVMLRSWDTGSDNYAYYLCPIFSDSPMSMTVRGNKYSMEQLISGMYDDNGKYHESGFIKLVDQELQRIKYVTEDRAKAIKEGKIQPISNYEKNGAKFCVIPELNTYTFDDGLTLLEKTLILRKEYSKLLDKKAGALESAIRQLEILAITDVMNSKFDEFFTGISDKVMNEIAEKLGKDTLNDIKDIKNELFVPYLNMIYANSLIVELTVVDPAFSKSSIDFQKRFKEVYAGGTRLNTNSKYGRKTERVILIADDMITSPSYKNIQKIVENSKGRLSQKDIDYILGQYRFLKDKKNDGINVSDGLALRSLSSYKSIMDMMGKWDDNMEESLNRFKEGTWLRKDFDTIYMTIKPFVYSVIAKDSGIDNLKIPVPIQHKNSELALLAMYDVINASLRNSPTLKGINRFLEETHDVNGNPLIDMIQYESAGKSGNQGVVNINFSSNKVMEAVKSGFINVGNKSYTIFSLGKDSTLKTVVDDFDDIKDIFTKKLIDNEITLDEFNDIMTYFQPTEKEVIEVLCNTALNKNQNGYYEVNDSYVLEVPFDDYMIALPTPEHHMDALTPFGSLARNIITADLPENFLLNLEGKKEIKTLKKNDIIDFYYKLINENTLDEYSKLKELFKDKKSFRDIVNQMSKTSPKYGRDFAEAFLLDSDGNFVLSPSSPTMFREIQLLVTSLFRNRISAQKVNGASLIQASGIGLRDDLKLVYDENNKLVGAECYIPATSKAFFDAFTKETVINGNKVLILDIDKLKKAGLDKAIGFRIPTENKSSMLPIIIKGFSPQLNGSTIFLPTEITSISGSDFDVDKLFVMLSSFYTKNIYDIKSAWNDFYTDAANKDIANEIDKNYGEQLHKFIKEQTEDWDEAASLDDIKDITDEFNEWLDKQGIKKYNFSETALLRFNDWFKDKKDDYFIKQEISIAKYDFSKPVEKNSKKARTNMIIQIMYKILTSQEGAEGMLNPQNFEDVKREAKMMKIINSDKLLTEFRKLAELSKKSVDYLLLNSSVNELQDFIKKYDDEYSPIYPQTFTHFHNQNMAGNNQLGIYAIQVSAAAKFQRANIIIKEANRFSINGREIKDVDKLIPGEHRLKNCSQFVGACADNGKDPNVTDFGSNQQSATIISYLLRAGLSMTEASLIINQPVMKEFNYDDYEIKKNYNLKENTINNPSVNSETLLKNILKDPEITDNDRRDIAIICYKVIKLSQALDKLTKISRADSPNGGMKETFAKARIQKYRVDLFNGEQHSYGFPFYPINAAVSNTKIDISKDTDSIREQLSDKKMAMLDGFYSMGIQPLNQLLKPYFFMLDNSFEDSIAHTVFQNMPLDLFDDSMSDIVNKMYMDYITYRLSDSDLFGDEKDSSMGSKMKWYLTKFPTEYIKVLNNNPDIKEAVGNILTVDNGRIILYNVGLIGKGQKDEIKRRLTSLLYLDNPEALKLAKDLFIYSYYDNGLRFTPNSFSNMFTTLFVTKINGYNETLDNLDKPITEEDAQRFIYQFITNNPSAASDMTRFIMNNDSVEKDNIVIDRHSNHFFDNPYESGVIPYQYFRYSTRQMNGIFVLSDYNADTITYSRLPEFNALRTVYNSKLNQDLMASEFHHYEDVADSFKESTLGMIGNNNIKNSIAAQLVEASIGTSLENYEDAPATDDVPPADFNTLAFDDFDFNDLKSFALDKDNISPLDEITPDEQYNGSAKIDDHLC